MGHADLGQQRGGGGKDSGEKRPANPVHVGPVHVWMVSNLAAALKCVMYIRKMEHGRPSKTALRVAIRRAAHQLVDHPCVLNDPIALRLVGPGSDRDLERASHEAARDFRAFMATRSRFVEDQLATAVASGVTQYVILGAGLDTFAYRNPFASLHVFEVDFPATQEWKRWKLAEAGIAEPANLTFVPLDFEHKALGEGLREAGFDAARAA